MRVRAAVAIVVLLFPAAVSAQRIRAPRLGGRGAARPAPLPPQAPAIAREMAYKRLNYSVEAYPLVSYIHAPGFSGAGTPASWTTYGMGSRLDYRFARYASATLDMTSSWLGGPATTETAELGMRLHPQRSEKRVYPFMDFRVGYARAFESYFRPGDFAAGGSPGLDPASGARSNYGFGVAAGTGFEFALTRTVSLTTGGSILRANMHVINYRAPASLSNDYVMTAYRYTLGIKWNPVRLMKGLAPDQP